MLNIQYRCQICGDVFIKYKSFKYIDEEAQWFIPQTERDVPDFKMLGLTYEHICYDCFQHLEIEINNMRARGNQIRLEKYNMYSPYNYFGRIA